MRRLLLAACLVSTACAPMADASRRAPPLPLATGSPVASASRGVAAPSPSRGPTTLPVFPEEAAVIAAIDAAGIRLTLIGGSKFETLLGERQRARVFIEQAGPGGTGADVLFLERPISNVRVCFSKTAAGLNRNDIFIGDRLVGSVEGTQTAFYSFSGRYFIQASSGSAISGKRFSDALMAGLGTVTPPC